MSTPNTPSPKKTLTHLICAYLLLNDENRARIRRIAIAIGRNDIPALEALKADTPAECTPILDSMIVDAQEVQQ